MVEAMEARAAEVFAEEATEPVEWWWLSFADPELPEGSQFLGVVIIEARGMMGAVTLATMLGLNPGGEIQGVTLPDEVEVPADWTCRLLTKAEAERGW